ncbi:MAG: DUF2283 domain-containing protein [Candidatus Bathyarchaeia archaeon]
MRINYDAEEDILYIIIREIDEDIRVEYNLKKEIVGIEIMNAKT